jgi:hypothetical protein
MYQSYVLVGAGKPSQFPVVVLTVSPTCMTPEVLGARLMVGACRMGPFEMDVFVAVAKTGGVPLSVFEALT